MPQSSLQSSLPAVHPMIANDPAYQAGLAAGAASGQPAQGPVPGAPALANVKAMLSTRLAMGKHPDSAIGQAALGAFADHADGLTADQTARTAPGEQDTVGTLLSALRDGSMLKRLVVQRAFAAADDLAGPAALVDTPSSAQGMLKGHGDAFRRLTESYAAAHPEAVPGSTSTGTTGTDGEAHPFVGQLAHEAVTSANTGQGTTVGDLLQFKSFTAALAAHGQQSNDTGLRADSRAAQYGGIQTQVLIDRAMDTVPNDARRAYMLARHLDGMDAKALVGPYVTGLIGQVIAQPDGVTTLAQGLTNVGDHGQAIMQLHDAISREPIDTPVGRQAGRAWFAYTMKPALADAFASASAGAASANGTGSVPVGSTQLTPDVQRLLGVRLGREPQSRP